MKVVELEAGVPKRFDFEEHVWRLFQQPYSSTLASAPSACPSIISRMAAAAFAATDSVIAKLHSLLAARWLVRQKLQPRVSIEFEAISGFLSTVARNPLVDQVNEHLTVTSTCSQHRQVVSERIAILIVLRSDSECCRMHLVVRNADNVVWQAEVEKVYAYESWCSSSRCGLTSVHASMSCAAAAASAGWSGRGAIVKARTGRTKRVWMGWARGAVAEGGGRKGREGREGREGRKGRRCS